MRLGITIGDPGGIGPEVALRAALEEGLPLNELVLVGPAALWQHHIALLANGHAKLREALHTLTRQAVFEDTADPGAGSPVELGRTSARFGAVAVGAIERAAAMALDGRLDAIATAPVSKEGIRAAGSRHPGHTEMLRDLCGAADTTMAFAGGGLHVALATIHVPLRAVFELLTPDLIVRRARHLDAFVRRLGVAKPRLALCGLNPHASEGGMFGDEETRILAPAIEAAGAEGIGLSGPWPPDTVFHEARSGKHDAVLALYHDQGLIAVKTVAFDEAVNVTLGLPIVRTSPDHGTAFDIAGRGIARTGSMRAALRMAARLAAEKGAR